MPLSRAAVVVRTFAWVAAIIPRYPAAAEATAPTRNEVVVTTPSGETASAIASSDDRDGDQLQLARMNVFAPARIMSAISVGAPSMAG